MNPLKLNTKPGANAMIAALLFWGLFVLLLLIFGPVSPIFGTSYSRLIYGLSGVASALLATWLFLRYEQQSFKDIGLTWRTGTIGRLLKGFLIGAAIFGVILLALLILTPLQIHRNTKPVDAAALLNYLAFIPLSLMEELAFRSYPFVRLHERFGLRATQVIIAIAFALWHVIGGQPVFGSFLGPGVYAFVFGLAAVWSGGIAVPVGIHIALNILQPLTGMRGDAGAVWTLSQKTNAAGALAATETIGLAMQLVIFVAAILLTEYYVRKNGNQLSKKPSAIDSDQPGRDPFETDPQQRFQPTAAIKNEG